MFASIRTRLIIIGLMVAASIVALIPRTITIRTRGARRDHARHHGEAGAAQVRPRSPGRRAPRARARPVEAGLGRSQAGSRPRADRAPQAHRRVRRERAARSRRSATTASWSSWPASPTRAAPRRSCSAPRSSSSRSPTRPVRSTRRCPSMDRVLHDWASGCGHGPRQAALGGAAAPRHRHRQEGRGHGQRSGQGRRARVADPARRRRSPAARCPGEYLVPETAFPRVDSLLNLPEVQRVLPRGVTLRWSAAADERRRAVVPLPVRAGGEEHRDRQQPRRRAGAARSAHERPASSPSSWTAPAAASSARRPGATSATTWRSSSTVGSRGGRR